MWAVCLITEKSVTFCIERQFSLWKIIRHLRKVACWKNSGVKEEKDTFFIHHCLFAKSGEGNGIPLQYSCLENPLDRGAWKAAVHGVPKSRTRLSDFTFTFHFYALEKEMATHSSVLAWRLSGKGEPGGLPSMGSHRVGHDWSNLAAAAAASAVVAKSCLNLLGPYGLKPARLLCPWDFPGKKTGVGCDFFL